MMVHKSVHNSPRREERGIGMASGKPDQIANPFSILAQN